MWQASNPDSYDIPAQADAIGTYTNAPGSTEDGNTGKFTHLKFRLCLVLII